MARSLAWRCCPAPGRGRSQLLVLDQPAELLECPVYVFRDGARGDSLGQPAAQAGAGHHVGQAKLDAGAPAGRLAQAPPPAVVEPDPRFGVQAASVPTASFT